MSDPRDELLDRIHVALHRIPVAIERAFHVDADLVKRVVQSRDSSQPGEIAALAHEIEAQASRKCALALGQCQEIAEELLRELERFKRARANKTGSG